jgi:Leucine-rich repeat (LRR) protein|tara:strand:+ start:61 stop:429 length:369 start_codon:yes stop_codon:yes gene_type:complete
MKQILLILAVVALVGCGGRKEKEEKAAKAKAVSEAKEESAKVIEATIRRLAKKPTGELTKADLEKVTTLSLYDNQLTDVKGLEKLTQLTILMLDDNPDLTEAQIAELQKALLNCGISSNPKK